GTPALGPSPRRVWTPAPTTPASTRASRAPRRSRGPRRRGRGRAPGPARRGRPLPSGRRLSRPADHRTRTGDGRGREGRRTRAHAVAAARRAGGRRTRAWRARDPPHASGAHAGERRAYLRTEACSVRHVSVTGVPTLSMPP